MGGKAILVSNITAIVLNEDDYVHIFVNIKGPTKGIHQYTSTVIVPDFLFVVKTYPYQHVFLTTPVRYSLGIIRNRYHPTSRIPAPPPKHYPLIRGGEIIIVTVSFDGYMVVINIIYTHTQS